MGLNRHEVACLLSHTWSNILGRGWGVGPLMEMEVHHVTVNMANWCQTGLSEYFRNC